MSAPRLILKVNQTCVEVVLILQVEIQALLTQIHWLELDENISAYVFFCFWNRTDSYLI